MLCAGIFLVGCSIIITWMFMDSQSKAWTEWGVIVNFIVMVLGLILFTIGCCLYQ